MSHLAGPTPTCPSCGAGCSPGAKFCSNCAAPLATTTRDAGERRQVTVLFSDLTGYTALVELVDAEVAREIMSRIFGHAAEIV